MSQQRKVRYRRQDMINPDAPRLLVQTPALDVMPMLVEFLKQR